MAKAIAAVAKAAVAVAKAAVAVVSMAVGESKLKAAVGRHSANMVLKAVLPMAGVICNGTQMVKGMVDTVRVGSQGHRKVAEVGA